jgi:glycosyltransferase involved in cell wall biosynthesis
MIIVKILYPWMPDYRVDFFRELVKLGLEDRIYYQVFAGSPPRELGKPEAQQHAFEFFQVRSKEITLFRRSIIRYQVDKSWRKADLVVVEHSVRSLNTWLWTLFARPKKIAMWGHGRTYTKRKYGFEEKIKDWLTRKSDWFFSYTEGGKKALIEIGYPQHQITVINNSSPISIQLKSINLEPKEIDSFSEHYDFQGKRLGVFIGAFSKDKRIDLILEAAQIVAQAIPNFVLVFFGEGPEGYKIEEASRTMPWIKIGPYATPEILKLIGLNADVILMPGRVGLIAVDSFALGVPIVTTDFSYHAPEFEYLRHDENSIITEDNVLQFANGVIALLQDSEKKNRLVQQCKEDSERYSIDSMARSFHDGVKSSLDLQEKT